MRWPVIELLGFGVIQNPKYTARFDKKRNRIIFNLFSVILHQHRRLFVGHPVFRGLFKLLIVLFDDKLSFNQFKIKLIV